MTKPNESRELPIVGYFSDPRAYDHPVDAVEMVETHISWVFLTGRYAYKVKKPVTLPFVDFGTLEQRRVSCEDEVRLNRRLAPSLYLGVVAIGGPPDAPRIGAEPVIEYAVKMRQFPSSDRLDARVASGDVDAAPIRELAATIAAFHSTLPGAETPRAGGTNAPRAAGAAPPPEIDAFLVNLGELEAALAPASADRPQILRDWLEARRPALASRLAGRRANGFVRECHGDLHLENLVLLDGRVTPFDALEFSEKLRTIDVIDEVGFLTMDFAAHGRDDLGLVFLNRYLEITGDYTGLALLDFYMLHRALVRAKVRAIRRGQTGAASGTRLPYLELAERIAQERRRRLVITRGLSGSGKTRLAQSLVAALPAISIRSDLERKRLFGLAPDADSESGIASGIYAPGASERTYRALERAAEAALESNLDVIVDAAFLERAERRAFAALASRRGADFLVLDCEAPEAVLRDRIATRRAAGKDASEATADVLDHQLATAETLGPDEREAAITVDTTGALDADSTARRIREATAR